MDKENSFDLHNRAPHVVRSSVAAGGPPVRKRDVSVLRPVSAAADQEDGDECTQCTCGRSVKRSTFQHSKICNLFNKQRKQPTKVLQARCVSRTPPFAAAKSNLRALQRAVSPPPSPSLSLHWTPDTSFARSPLQPSQSGGHEDDEDESNALCDDVTDYGPQDEEDSIDGECDDANFTPDVVRGGITARGEKAERKSGLRGAAPMVVLSYLSDSEDEEGEEADNPSGNTGHAEHVAEDQDSDGSGRDDGDEEENEEEADEDEADEEGDEDEIIIPCSQPIYRSNQTHEQGDDEEKEDSERIESEEEDEEEEVVEQSAEEEGEEEDEEEEELFISQASSFLEDESAGCREELSIIKDQGRDDRSEAPEDDDFSFRSFIATQDPEGLSVEEELEGSVTLARSSLAFDEREEAEEVSSAARRGNDCEPVAEELREAEAEREEGRDETAPPHHAHRCTAEEEEEIEDALLVLLRALRLDHHHARFVEEEVSLSDVMLLTDEELERHLGLRLGPRRRLRHAIAQLDLPPAFSSSDARLVQATLNNRHCHGPINATQGDYDNNIRDAL